MQAVYTFDVHSSGDIHNGLLALYIQGSGVFPYIRITYPYIRTNIIGAAYDAIRLYMI